LIKIDQPTETQNRENPATQSHGSKAIIIILTTTARLPKRSFWKAPRPDFEPKVSGSGSQRVPLLTIMSGNGGADAVINGGSKTV
jgi:hypothetical protein